MRSFSGSLLILAVAISLPLVACDQLGIGAKKEDKKEEKKSKSSDDEEEEEKAEATATATATATAEATATATAVATATATAEASATASESAVASATETASASASASGTAAALAGHSPVPTTQEWEAVKEVPILNAKKLGCEGKALREWVRVSCKDKNDTGGTPTSVSLDKPNDKADIFTFASGGVTSVVFPFEDGRELEATFGWSDKSVKLKSSWPKGAPKPPSYGEFDAPPPAPIAAVTTKKPEPKKPEPVKTVERPVTKPGPIIKPVIKPPRK